MVVHTHTHAHTLTYYNTHLLVAVSICSQESKPTIRVLGLKHIHTHFNREKL